MAQGYLITEEERDLLRALMAREQQQSRNTRNRPHVPIHDEPAPEVYLARVGEFDIPSRVGHTVYSRDCNIYRILNGQLTAISGLNRLVWNRHLCALRASTYVEVRRDKFGQWLADPECCEGEETDTGTGTGTLTTTGTGTGTLEGCDPVTVQETDVRCEGGSLNVYGRTVWLDLVGGCLAKLVGGWTFLREEGCCDCTDIITGTGTGITGTATSTSDGCNCLVLPNYYVFYVAGFSSVGCTPFNGYFTAARTGGCTYVVIVGNVTATLTIDSSGPGNRFTLSLVNSVTGANITYSGTTGDTDCCIDLRLNYLSGNCAPRPASIIIYPGTPCHTPTGTGGTATHFDTGTGPMNPGYTGTSTGTGVFPSCCPDPVASILYVTMVPAFGTTLRFKISHTGSNVWEGSTTLPCGETITLRYRCVLAGPSPGSCTTFDLQFKCSGTFTNAPQGGGFACTCDPLIAGPYNVTISGSGTDGCGLACVATYTVTITE